MADRLAKTQEILAKHHRDGERFADLMRETYTNRFNEAFWAEWQQHVAPLLAGDHPLVLDLGTGPALFLRELVSRYPGVEAVGVDCAPWMLEAAGELPPGCRIVCEDLHDPQLPFADGTVDAALAAVVIHELTHPVALLREMRRCLRPGAILFVLDWVRTPLEIYLQHEANAGKVFSEMDSVALDDIFTHFIEHNRYSADDLGYLLQQSGFDVRQATHYNEDRFVRLIACRRDAG
jgi:arsenite methyltransferase